MYQYSSFHTYIDCHVTKNKVQAGAVTSTKFSDPFRLKHYNYSDMYYIYELILVANFHVYFLKGSITKLLWLALTI
jgi:hypothetical protein